MGWLSGWKRRMQITIDHLDIASTLSNFPVLIYLSVSSGLSSKDVSFIFTELNGQSKKIAVTESDGVTECYVEVEKWDADNKQAWLWTKISSISSVDDTVIYLYFDNLHGDNTTYVGDPTDAVAQNVWDTNFVGVYHLSETAGGTNAIKDSTLNAIHGSTSGTLTFNQSGIIGKCINFVPPSKIDFGNPAAVDASSITVETWVKPFSPQVYADDRIVTNYSGATNKWALTLTSGGGYCAMTNTNLSHATAITSGTILGAWHYIVGTTNPEAIYDNAVLHTTTRTDSWSFESNLKIASRGTNYWYKGDIDEVRISNTTRLQAWITATYETERDHLLTFGDFEEGDQLITLTGLITA